MPVTYGPTLEFDYDLPNLAARVVRRRRITYQEASKVIHAEVTRLMAEHGERYDQALTRLCAEDPQLIREWQQCRERNP
jgi:hypothetical protein